MTPDTNKVDDTVRGTITGTAFTVAASIGVQDMLKTAVIAAIGALVSFSATVFLKWLTKKLK